MTLSVPPCRAEPGVADGSTVEPDPSQAAGGACEGLSVSHDGIVCMTQTAPGSARFRLNRPAAAADVVNPTDEQRGVIDHQGRRLRVLAGPGTGKSTTLVAAVADRIGRRGVPPEQILVLTFSRRAAAELTDEDHPAGRRHDPGTHSCGPCTATPTPCCAPRRCAVGEPVAAIARRRRIRPDGPGVAGGPGRQWPGRLAGVGPGGTGLACFRRRTPGPDAADRGARNFPPSGSPTSVGGESVRNGKRPRCSPASIRMCPIFGRAPAVWAPLWTRRN